MGGVFLAGVFLLNSGIYNYEFSAIAALRRGIQICLHMFSQREKLLEVFDGQ